MLDGVRPEMLLALLDDADEADAMRAVLAAHRRMPWSTTARNAFEALVVECAEEVGRG